MKNHLKKVTILLLICSLFLSMSSTVYAEESAISLKEVDDHLSPISNEITPYGQFYTLITTRISQVATGKVYLQVEVNCIETVSSIQSTITLQKLVSGIWVDVASKSVSASNVKEMTKTVSASGLSSGGTYRTKSSTKITGYNGLSETATGYSGSIILK